MDPVFKHPVEQIVLYRSGLLGVAQCNIVPWLIKKQWLRPHDGIEWGYSGSGSTLLAQSILAYVGYYDDSQSPIRVKEYEGRAFVFTLRGITTTFRDQVLAAVPKEGGQLAFVDIQQWIRVYRTKITVLYGR